MGASSPMCDLLVVRCSNIFCALRHSWRAVAEISSLRVFALCPQRNIFLAGISEQPRPPTRPTRVHGSARSIFGNHPQHYWPKLNYPLQATLAMQCNGAVASPHALPGLPSPRPTWELRMWYAIAFCALRHLWRARSALPSLHGRGTPRPVALGPTPLPKGTTSKGGGRCPGEPHARSHLGPMHLGEDVEEPTPPNVACTVPWSGIRTTASALLQASTPLLAAAAWV